ncbi:MAG: ParB/RepB/Spo0J family partition protein [Planctomycetota bacterium]
MQVDDAPAESPTKAETKAPAAADDRPAGAPLQVAVEEIKPNPHQPRRAFGPASLAELAASLKVNGVIQPLVATRRTDGSLELVAGERRLRAAKLAQLSHVPVVLRETDASAQAEMALVENIQREDLNPIDRGEAYKALQRQLGVTQIELAERLGEDRGTVNAHFRILELPEPIREMIRDDRLQLGHGKVLAGVEDADKQLRLANIAADQSLSVRQLERAAKEGETGVSKAGAERKAKDAYLSQLGQTLSKSIGTDCTVATAGKGGYKLTVTLRNAEQFDKFMDKLGVSLDT